jgi:hypothetical protein
MKMKPMSRATITALRAERESAAKMAPLPVRGRCPQPDKQVFASKQGADGFLKYLQLCNARNPSGSQATAIRSYLCGCGWYHVTSFPYGTS